MVGRTTPLYNVNVLAKYFDNTITGTSTPNFKLYIQSLGQTIHIAGILLKISYKIII